MENYKKLIKEVADELLESDNVVSVGYGYKIVDGVKTSTPSIVCGVVEKKPVAMLEPIDVIPPVIHGYPSDVVEIGEIKVEIDRTEKLRPCHGGMSIGHKYVTAGTLGCVVRGADGLRYILSNNHVLANSNNAAYGDWILQPGPVDGGESSDVIGLLEDWVTINYRNNQTQTEQSFLGDLCARLPKWLRDILCAIFGLCCAPTPPPPDGPNKVDAAIARIVLDADVSDEILGVGQINGVAEAELGSFIQKSGRTTGYTTGEVLQLGAVVDVSYGDGLIARFEDQIIAGNMSAGGDSGSAVLDADENIVGLLFAGSSQSTIINRIQNVFEALRITL